MQKYLEQIATLSTGYSFRGAVPTDSSGQVAVIQAGSVTDDGVIDFCQIVRVSSDSISEEAVLVDGDVLLVSRGIGKGSFRAAVFCSEESAVASGSLHVLRIQSNLVSPQYLCSYLNSDAVQSRLASLATGSSVKTLALGELRRLQIPIPSEEQQAILGRLRENLRIQKHLLARKESLLQQVGRSAITFITS